MSTTAQDEQTTLTGAGGAAEPQAAQPTTPEAQAKASNTREYTLFEEARTDTWTQIGKAQADTQEAAIESLGEQKLKSGQRFMAVPTRFVRPVKPKVTTVTSISFD